jgi:hypothetical protein
MYGESIILRVHVTIFSPYEVPAKHLCPTRRYNKGYPYCHILTVKRGEMAKDTTSVCRRFLGDVNVA